jgi:hypothetical protein
VLDLDALHREQGRERDDATSLVGLRGVVLDTLRGYTGEEDA